MDTKEVLRRCQTDLDAEELYNYICTLNELELDMEHNMAVKKYLESMGFVFGGFNGST